MTRPAPEGKLKCCGPALFVLRKRQPQQENVRTKGRTRVCRVFCLRPVRAGGGPGLCACALPCAAVCVCKRARRVLWTPCCAHLLRQILDRTKLGNRKPERLEELLAAAQRRPRRITRGQKNT